MSDQDKEMKDTEQKNGKDREPEKIQTRYDRKMQKRREEKEREAREKRISTILGVLIVAALACVVISFPVRSFLTVHGTRMTVAGEKVSQVEFDYNYNMVKNAYIAQYGSYMSMFGLDLTGDLSKLAYSDTQTWQEYFEETAEERILQNKALRKEAEKAGFSFDTAEEYAQYEEDLKDAAAQAETSLKAYVQQLYGPYATMSRLKGYVEEAMLVNAFYESISEERKPSEEDIQAYYEEHAEDYDSVDYHLITVNAELPTEPTELADPVDESEDQDAQDGDGETAYKPSEGEVAFAMEEAKKKAEDQQDTVAADGELRENQRKSAVASALRDWLFDPARKEGDTTVIENSTSNLYYVVAFDRRYLDQEPSADVRVIATQEDNAQAILDEWKGGAATEESFGQIADNYNDSQIFAAEGGLSQGVLPNALAAELSDWIFDSARAAGDTAVISPENEELHYVLYYVGPNDPRWSLEIEQTLLSQRMTEYVDEVTEPYRPEEEESSQEGSDQEESDQEQQDSQEGTEGNTDGSNEGGAQ